MSYRSEVPFFHEPETHRAVGVLAGSDTIVIYLGAGVTIDKTGVGWTDLVRRLLQQEPFHDLIRPRDAELVAGHLSPVEASTLAAHYYRSVHGDDWRPSLHATLQSLLYPGGYWRAGLLARNVVRLATALAASGKEVLLVTTNYDTHIEDEFQELASLAVDQEPDALLPEIVVKVLGATGHTISPTEPSSGRIVLTYLHGRVPRTGQTLGLVALTERDYFVLRSDVLDQLQSLFAKGSLFILGSSLTDPPLLAALQQASDSGANRYALTPVKSYRFWNEPDTAVVKLKHHLHERMREFGVELLFPDFYYQVPQFCEELITAVARISPSSRGYAADRDVRYGQRLDDWWKLWRARVETDPNERPYEHLANTLESVKSTLAPARHGITDSAGEHLKIEVWARWEPSAVSRRIALWAASGGIRMDYSSLRQEELVSDSSIHSVQAFLAGKPLLTEASVPGANRWRDGRWSTFLSVPITLDRPLGSVPVGVVTLAGSKPADQSRISVPDTNGMLALVEAMQTCGRDILSPASDY